MSYGVERYMSQTAIGVLGVAHHSLFVMAVTIIPTQFWYRYRLVSSQPSLCRLAGSFCMSLGVSTLLGVLALLGHLECRKRGQAFYEDMLDKQWFDEYGRSRFIDALDLVLYRDLLETVI
jgi:hypothetical protein